MKTKPANQASKIEPYVPSTAEEVLALQAPDAAAKVATARAPEPGTVGQANQTASVKAVAPDTARLQNLARHNRDAAIQTPPVQHVLVGREGPRFSNLPKQSADSLAIAATERATLAKRRATREASGGVLKKRWVTIGLQPASGGYVLHTQHYEGDTLLKTTVQRNLSPLAAREKLALHMSALFSVF